MKKSHAVLALIVLVAIIVFWLSRNWLYVLGFAYVGVYFVFKILLTILFIVCLFTLIRYMLRKK